MVVGLHKLKQKGFRASSQVLACEVVSVEICIRYTWTSRGSVDHSNSSKETARSRMASLKLALRDVQSAVFMYSSTARTNFKFGNVVPHLMKRGIRVGATLKHECGEKGRTSSHVALKVTQTAFETPSSRLL